MFFTFCFWQGFIYRIDIIGVNVLSSIEQHKQMVPGRMGNRTHQKALAARSLCVMDPVADAAVSQLTAARLAAVCGFGI